MSADLVAVRDRLLLIRDGLVSVSGEGWSEVALLEDLLGVIRDLEGAIGGVGDGVFSICWCDGDHGVTNEACPLNLVDPGAEGYEVVVGEVSDATLVLTVFWFGEVLFSKEMRREALEALAEFVQSWVREDYRVRTDEAKAGLVDAVGVLEGLIGPDATRRVASGVLDGLPDE